MSKELVPFNVDTLGVLEWREIIDTIVEKIDTDELPEKVIRMAEMMMSNYPMYKISKKLEVQTRTLKSWLKKYPALTLLIKNGRDLLIRWRLARIEQQFMHAADISEKVLTSETRVLMDSDGNPYLNDDGQVIYHEPDAKLLAVQAQQARYIIDLFFKHKDVIIIKTDDASDLILKANKGALEYVAKRVNEENIIDVDIRTIRTSAPLVDQDGKPFHGEIGKLDISKKGALCHICGKRYAKLALHVQTVHNLKADIYETEFELEEGSID